MFSEDNESQLFKAIKGLLYALMIGAVYYAAGYGWAVLFTKDEEKRERVAKYNLLALILETVFFVGMFIFGLTREKLDYSWMDLFLPLFLVHTALNILGSIIYVIWWALTSIFPGLQYNKEPKENNHVDKSLSQIQEYSSDISQRLLDIQNRTNNSTLRFINQSQVFVDDQELELKSKMIDSINNVIALYREPLQLQEYDLYRFEYFSVHELNDILEDLKTKIAIHINNLENQ